MPDSTKQIIKNRAVIDDAWLTIAHAEELAGASQDARLIITSALWRALDAEQRRALFTRGALGLQLAPNDEPADFAAELARFAVIAIEFPQFSDGRGYSLARLLRERYQYRGEVRAVGDVLRDQLFYMARCGFDAFAVRADKNIHDALHAFHDFSEVYQSSVEQPLPLFRRRQIDAYAVQTHTGAKKHIGPVPFAGEDAS